VIPGHWFIVGRIWEHTEFESLWMIGPMCIS